MKCSADQRRGNIAEIAGDNGLRRYGGALALVNVVTAMHWLREPKLSHILNPQVQPICWPFFPDCGELRVLSPDTIAGLTWVFLIVALWNAKLFLSPNRVGPPYYLLIAVSVIKGGVLLQDFRLTLNHHYMAYWVTLTFLFVPAKRVTVSWMIVWMYMWAGVLKVVPGSYWLTGAAFYGRHPLGLPQAMIPGACAYVIVLELVIVFGLLSARRPVFWASFLQLILFHLSSFWVVGLFYPVLMFVLLSIFLLAPCRLRGRHMAEVNGRPSQIPQPSRTASICLLAAFSAAQLVKYAFPGDSAITGEGRILALNMFDAPVECRATAVFHRAGEAESSLRLHIPYLNTRLWCDPIVYASFGRYYCRARHAGSKDDLDLLLETKKYGQTAFNVVVSIQSFCNTMPTYSLWHHNPWIRTSRQ